MAWKQSVERKRHQLFRYQLDTGGAGVKSAQVVSDTVIGGVLGLCSVSPLSDITCAGLSVTRLSPTGSAAAVTNQRQMVSLHYLAMYMHDAREWGGPSGTHNHIDAVALRSRSVPLVAGCIIVPEAKFTTHYSETQPCHADCDTVEVSMRTLQVYSALRGNQVRYAAIKAIDAARYPD